jgi:hypothetical protein
MNDFLRSKVNDPAKDFAADGNRIIAKIGYIEWKRCIAFRRRGKRLG